MRINLITVILTLSLLGCGTTKDAVTYPNPDALGKAFITTASARNFNELKTFYPTQAILEATLKCQDKLVLQQMHYAIKRKREQLMKAFNTVLKDFTMAWTSGKIVAEKSFKAGDSYQKICTFRKPVVIKKIQWDFSVTKGASASKSTSAEGLIWKIGLSDWYVFTF
jgi:hypothetical protein